ncbi:hypothetical protein [Bradyrhizobium sp. SZCCHNR3003]|uniref:hypothetical protein n=1 Tax=Bradyrhizobium sp. SZCCHNR3003 TaxID=3057387 RepID=UPI002915D1F6|nr:hypothetical protein [Bradyrhizobium sp. SZCCHNR3003]
MQNEYKTERETHKRRGYIPAQCVKFIQALYEKNSSNLEMKSEKTHETGVFIATIVIAGAAVLSFVTSLVQAFIFQEQLSAMKRADETTRESFTSVQRAFVVVTDFSQSQETIGDMKGWRVTPLITNIGNTSTTNFEFIEVTSSNSLQIETNYEWSREHHKEVCLARMIGNPADPDAFFAAKPRRPLGAVNLQINRANIGPKEFTKPILTTDNDRFVSYDLFKAALNKGISPFFYGEIRYNDIFPGTKKHVTKYCYGLFGIRGDNPPVGSPVFARCSHWNCTDEECVDDRKRFEAEIAEAAKSPKANCP